MIADFMTWAPNVRKGQSEVGDEGSGILFTYSTDIQEGMERRVRTDIVAPGLGKQGDGWGQRAEACCINHWWRNSITSLGGQGQRKVLGSL